uniref:Uncharacterized protein n=1 Tax=Arundo donax TaxID=35708 RepID=A0A0A8Z214_ARUDO
MTSISTVIFVGLVLFSSRGRREKECLVFLGRMRLWLSGRCRKPEMLQKVGTHDLLCSTHFLAYLTTTNPIVCHRLAAVPLLFAS